MRCPTCKHDTLVARADPRVNPKVPRLCFNCGQSFQPLMISRAQFFEWDRQQKAALKRADDEWEKKIDQMARDIVDKRRRGILVTPGAAEDTVNTET